MAAEWWSLPGPAALVSAVSRELRRGRNVIIGMPPDVPDGFRPAVRGALEEGTAWQVLIADPFRSPLDLLWEEFVVDESPGERRNIDSLVRRTQLRSGVVWIGGVDLALWPQWRDFILRYSHACANLPVLHRMLLCCAVPLRVATGPISDVCCVSIRCADYAAPLDILTFASSRTGSPPNGQRLESEVRASVAAALALWDPELCLVLLDQPTGTLLDPYEAIRAWAIDRRWRADLSDNELEGEGLLCTFGMGEKRLHSAIHALRSDAREIQLRVWRGQVGVLLPFVEERRRDLLQVLEPWLALPFQPERGPTITDAADLELGHLYRMFSGDRRVNGDCWALIQTLRDMRNSLAHFDPVASDQLHAPELADFRRILDRVRPQNGSAASAKGGR